MSAARHVIFCILMLGSAVPAVRAQGAHPIPVEDGIYLSIGRLQTRGYLLELNPTVLPYSEAEIRAALKRVPKQELDTVERYWFDLIESRLGHVVDASDQATVGIRLLPGLRATNNGRLDAVRYLKGGDDHVFQNALLQLRFEAAGAAAALGVRHDLYYDRDPDGLDTALRWLTRTEDSYIRYDARWIGLELGRFSRHWGLPGRASVLVSSNPRSYDQIGFRLGGPRFSIRSILGELDSVTADGRFTGAAGDDSVRVGSERRYVAFHRLDWRPNRNLVVSFLQSTLYSGPNSSPSLKYLNPFHSVIFALDTLPKNDENNGIVGMGLWYRSEKATFHFQGIVDDVDVLNLNEPISYAVAASVEIPQLARRLDVWVGGEAVTSRTYNTIQPEGRYIYLLRGLATQFSDYVAVNLEADYHAWGLAPGLTVSPRLDVLWQGERDIRQPYPDSDRIRTILTGTVERTVRTAVRVRYEPNAFAFVSIDAGANHLSNAGGVSGQSMTKLIVVFEFGLRLSLDHAFGIGFPGS